MICFIVPPEQITKHYTHADKTRAHERKYIRNICVVPNSNGWEKTWNNDEQMEMHTVCAAHSATTFYMCLSLFLFPPTPNKFYGVKITIDINNMLKFYFSQFKWNSCAYFNSTATGIERISNWIEEIRINFEEFCKIIMAWICDEILVFIKTIKHFVEHSCRLDPTNLGFKRRIFHYYYQVHHSVAGRKKIEKFNDKIKLLNYQKSVAVALWI